MGRREYIFDKVNVMLMIHFLFCHPLLIFYLQSQFIGYCIHRKVQSCQHGYWLWTIKTIRNGRRYIHPPSHKNMCTFHSRLSYKIMGIPFIDSYLNLLPLYIKLFTIYTTITTLIMMRISLSTNTILTTFLLLYLILPIFFFNSRAISYDNVFVGGSIR